MALVCRYDLLSFINKKILVDFVPGSKTVYFKLKELQAEKDYFGKRSEQAKYQI